MGEACLEGECDCAHCGDGDSLVWLEGSIVEGLVIQGKSVAGRLFQRLCLVSKKGMRPQT